MCYAVIKAKFGLGEEPQTIMPETAEDCAARVAALQANDHCVSIKVFTASEIYSRESIWVKA